LNRTQIGSFSIDESISLSDVSYEKGLPIEMALRDMPRIDLTDIEYNMISNGKPARLNATAEKVLLAKNGVLIAVYYRDGDIYRSKRGF